MMKFKCLSILFAMVIMASTSMNLHAQQNFQMQPQTQQSSVDVSDKEMQEFVNIATKINNLRRSSQQEMAKAIEDKASGIIAPSADADDLIDIFGEEIYTGVTGVEKHPVSVLLTEGFGDKVMPNETASLLENYIGQSITIIPKTNLQTPKKLPDIYLYKK